MEPRSAVTLKAVTRLAGLLFRLRAAFIVLALVAAGWFVVSVLDSASSSARSLVALSLLLWAGLALAIGFTLVRPPPRAIPADGWRERLRKRALNLLYWLATLGCAALCGFSVQMSLRALRLFFA